MAQHRSDTDVPRARGAVYALLARAFAYPEPAHLAAIREIGTALPAVREPRYAAAVTLAAATPAPEVLVTAFVRLFTHGVSRDCPTFETAYTARDAFQQAQQMADIAGFYRAFGVRHAPGGERPDHISAELEFMYFLTLKEAYAREVLGGPRVHQCRRAQALFLRDHLACWAPAFGRRVALLDPEGWYGRAGRLLVDWVEAECEALRVQPALTVAGPRLPWPEPDDGTCGTADTDGDPCAGCAPPSSPSERRDAMPLPLLEQ
jgi:DMSO reductase family type II enzyme chaperone